MVEEAWRAGKKDSGTGGETERDRGEDGKCSQRRAAETGDGKKEVGCLEWRSAPTTLGTRGGSKREGRGG